MYAIESLAIANVGIFQVESGVVMLLLQLFCCASTPGNDPQDLMSLFYKTVFNRLHSIKHKHCFWGK